MTGEIIQCPYFDGGIWGGNGACRAVRNWNVRGGALSDCTEQDQKDFSDFHGTISGITNDYGPLFGRSGEINSEVDKRLQICGCPMVTMNAGRNRESRRVQG